MLNLIPPTKSFLPHGHLGAGMVIIQPAAPCQRFQCLWVHSQVLLRSLSQSMKLNPTEHTLKCKYGRLGESQLDVHHYVKTSLIPVSSTRLSSKATPPGSLPGFPGACLVLFICDSVVHWKWLQDRTFPIVVVWIYLLPTALYPSPCP